jgi:hypothetical protein
MVVSWQLHVSALHVGHHQVVYVRISWLPEDLLACHEGLHFTLLERCSCPGIGFVRNFGVHRIQVCCCCGICSIYVQLFLPLVKFFFILELKWLADGKSEVFATVCSRIPLFWGSTAHFKGLIAPRTCRPLEGRTLRRYIKTTWSVHSWT